MIVANSRRELPDLLQAVEQRGACSARLVQTVPVKAKIDEDRTLDLVVHVYELSGCVMTRRAYAWSAGDDVHTALDIGPICSPVEAVHATLADRDRRSNLARLGLREAALAQA
jgi:hypothetical protein